MRSIRYDYKPTLKSSLSGWKRGLESKPFDLTTSKTLFEGYTTRSLWARVGAICLHLHLTPRTFGTFQFQVFGWRVYISCGNVRTWYGKWIKYSGSKGGYGYLAGIGLDVWRKA